MQVLVRFGVTTALIVSAERRHTGAERPCSGPVSMTARCPGLRRVVTSDCGRFPRGAPPASDVEELAEKKGIGRAQLERGKEVLGVTVRRLDAGRGVCYALPSQVPETAEA